MTKPGNIWLYAVVPAGRRPPDLSGVAGESPHVVAADSVAAVAGSVPHADFDEEPLKAHLENAVWLERAIRAHHRVVDVLARSGPVLPLRFATLYHDDERVVAMLRAHHEELLAALDRITGRVEWGIKLYLAQVDAPGARTPDGTDDPTNQTNPAADPPRPGTAYLLRRKARREDLERAVHRAAAAAEQIHATLADTAVESTRHPLQSAEASGRREPMVLNGAYLIDGGRQAAFDAAVDALVSDHAELRMEMTGPWPPYSFSGAAAWPAGD